MTRFFRRYSRTLLTVFMALLLVAFLVPNTVQGCGENREQNRTWGEIDGRRITDETLAPYKFDLRVLEKLGFASQMTEEDYYLRCEETRQAGIRVGRDEAIDFLNQRGVDEDARRDILATGISSDRLCDAVARWIGVLRLMETQMSAMLPSVPRREMAFVRERERMTASLATINTAALLPLVPEPNEAEIQAFFAQGADRFTNHTKTELSFGYREPNRVQIEYMTVDPASVKIKIQVRDRDVKKHFDENLYKFAKRDPNGLPLGEPNYEEVKAQVKEDLRTKRAQEKAEQIVNEMRDEAQRPWLTEGEDGFMVPPAGPLVSFEELKTRFGGEYEVQCHKTELLLDEKGLKALPGIGRASAVGIGRGQQNLPFAEYALRVKGILDKRQRNDLPALNVGEPSPVLIAGNMRNNMRYFFRVIKAERSHAPELAEVRDQVIRDWKTARAFELGRTYAEKVAEQARTLDGGLAGAVTQATELTALLQAAEQKMSTPTQPATRYETEFTKLEPRTLQRTPRLTDPVAAVSEAIFAALDNMPDPSAKVVVVAPQTRDFKWVVAQKELVQPLYAGDFEDFLAQGDNETQNSIFNEWLNADLLRERIGYKGLSPRNPEE